MPGNTALDLLDNIYSKIQNKKHQPDELKKILGTFSIFVSMIGIKLKQPLAECYTFAVDYQKTLKSYDEIIKKIDQFISIFDEIVDSSEISSLKLITKSYLLLLKATCYRFNNQIYFFKRQDGYPFPDEHKKQILINFKTAYQLLSDVMSLIHLVPKSSSLLISTHVHLNRAAFYLTQQQKKELLEIEGDFELDCLSSVNDACSDVIELESHEMPQSNPKAREELVDTFFVMLDQLRDYHYQRSSHYHFRRIVTSLRDRKGIPENVKKRFEVYFPELELDELISCNLKTLDSVKPFLVAAGQVSRDLDQIIRGMNQDTQTADERSRISDLESLLSKLAMIYQKFLSFINRYTPYLINEDFEDNFADSRFNINRIWLVLSHYLGSGHAYLAEMKKNQELDGYGENCHASKHYFGQAIVIAEGIQESIVGSIGLAQSFDNITEVSITAGIEGSFEPIFKTAKAAMQNKVSLFSRRWSVQDADRLARSKSEIIRNGFVVLGKLYDCYVEKMGREPAEFFAELRSIVSDCNDLKTKFDEFLSERVNLQKAVQAYVSKYGEGVVSENLEEPEEQCVPVCRAHYYSFKEVKYLSPLEFAIALQEGVMEDLVNSRHSLISNRFVAYKLMLEKEYSQLSKDETAREKQIQELIQIINNVSVFKEVVINLSRGNLKELQRDLLFDIQKIKGLTNQLLSDLNFDRCLDRAEFSSEDLDAVRSLRFNAVNAYDEALEYVSDGDARREFKKIIINISQCELALDCGSKRLPFDQENYDQEAITCIKSAIELFLRMKDENERQAIYPHLSKIFGRIVSFGYSGRISRFSIRKLLEKTESFWGGLDLNFIMSALVYFPERSLLKIQSSAENVDDRRRQALAFANQFTQGFFHLYQDYLLEVSQQSEEEQKQGLSIFVLHQLAILERYEEFHDVHIKREGRPTTIKCKTVMVNIDCAHQYMYLLLAMNYRMQSECSSDPTMLSKAQDALDKAETIIDRLGEIFDFYLGQSELADERCRLLLLSNKKNNISDQSLTHNMISLVRASTTHFVTALHKMKMEDEAYKKYSEKKLDLLKKLYESRHACAHQALVGLFGELRELSKIPSCIKNYINEVMGKELDDIDAARKAEEAQKLKEAEEQKQLQKAGKVNPHPCKRKSKNGHGLSREEREEKEKRKKEREEELARIEEQRRQRIEADRAARKQAKAVEKEVNRQREIEKQATQEAERERKEKEKEKQRALEEKRIQKEREDELRKEEEVVAVNREEQLATSVEPAGSSTHGMLEAMQGLPEQPTNQKEHEKLRGAEANALEAEFIKIATQFYPNIFSDYEILRYGNNIYRYYRKSAETKDASIPQDYPREYQCPESVRSALKNPTYEKHIFTLMKISLFFNDDRDRKPWRNFNETTQPLSHVK